MIAPVYYRRKREDVLTELPELVENQEWCALRPEEEQLYETAVLSKQYNEARRVSWNVEDLRNSSKASRMLELIQEAESEGRKVIVFSFFWIPSARFHCCSAPDAQTPSMAQFRPSGGRKLLMTSTKPPPGPCCWHRFRQAEQD